LFFVFFMRRASLARAKPSLQTAPNPLPPALSNSLASSLAGSLAGCGPFPPPELREALKRADLPKSAKERKGKKKREILERDSFSNFVTFAQLAIIHKYI
jgi:hypothetical protein